MNKFLWQIIGAILGAILGWLISYGFGQFLMDDDNSGFLIIVIFCFLGIVIGLFLGFVIAGEEFKKRSSF